MTPFGLEAHQGMHFHINRVMVWIEMRVCHGVFSAGVAEHMLGNLSAGHAVQMGGGGVPEKMGVQAFVNADAVGGASKDVLQGSRGYPLAAF